MLNITPHNSNDKDQYDKRFGTLNTLNTPSEAKKVARILIIIMVLFCVVLFLPWQQNIRARGEITALTPKDRPQKIQSPIDGTIAQWNVQEGQHVDSGQVLLTIAEVKDKYIDPDMILRLEEGIRAKGNAISAKEDKVLAKQRQLEALKAGLVIKLQQFDNKIEQSILKIEGDSIAWEASKVDLKNASRQYKANEELHNKGLISLTKLETFRSKYQQSVSKEVSARTKLEMARNEYQNAVLGKNAARNEALDKIAKTDSELSTTLSDIADSDAALAKARNELSSMEIRAGMRVIRAPQKGVVVQALNSGLGENIKSGQALLTLVPDKPQLAAAIYVKTMDVPLIEEGRHVRLRFDGWPSIQFSGWPSVSVGTFGGRVEVVDFMNQADGTFRVLIIQDKKEKDDDWPPELRMGTGVFGWVMLEEVPIWYELWRQINGFPPSLNDYKGSKKDAKK
ncbi:HlyD family efflux transporter periplasmic adaptor subunit [Flammeovirga yaeyamensis]|uniref:HlyD family efflux transporter periplasmic adaptor subunit n=1 Tax=Flammeovirga yaeyamensis TaxID=367791 RepID=A0AAX1NBB7_9BACT|nr:HlyD family efflux transporter periplasmic adaptor subunit [Flammeovirga yaeyamensis]MBB3697286.1 multidrug resistance efflux pump [Flammeovirga yaeyamensis]NMF33943.1 HlyD family efflux transporter periplasmic adaptor subunit [Flammeovirga yaeyamensis]QWG04797.1 HlyD family efflux transporter periplasmic adaptor subunit [Flammeovirga yaeyamensis]